jgi:gamma-glutamyl-gamma-aminobutyrate hydrolase PuuD
MNIAISMEMTRKLRRTWHAALNHEWYDFLAGHRIVPLCCHDSKIDLADIDLVILAGGNDMSDIKTWRKNHYPQRDTYEKHLLAYCQSHRVPVVGICRGFHFMNWVMGGTHRLMNDPYDSVQVNLPEFEVTCHHTIQIDQLASGFEVLQQDDRGVIELAIDRRLRMLGVGWHPERAVNTHTRPFILKMIDDLIA